jgi:predicted flap endonuclease-1-like 5' DNA nuclease
MNTTFALIIGIIIGYVGQWIVDFFLLRRKTRRLESELAEMRQEKEILEQALYRQETIPEEVPVEEQFSSSDEMIELEAEPVDVEAVSEAESLESLSEEVTEEIGDEGSRAVDVAAEVLLEDEQEAEAEEPPDQLESGSIFIPIEESEDETEAVEVIQPTPTEDAEWFFEEESQVDQDETRTTDLEGAKFKQDIEFIEGIGPAFGARLREIGIETPQDFLEQGATARGRDEISEQTGIPRALILSWVNQVDLYRIKGIGSEYAELLQAAGVNTVLELANRNPDNLHKRISELNAEFQRVRQLPSSGQVNDWIEQAKSLPRIVSY